MTPITSASIIAICVLSLVSLAAFKAGELHGVEQARSAQKQAKAEADYFMRDIGVCKWAEAISRQVECGGPKP